MNKPPCADAPRFFPETEELGEMEYVFSEKIVLPLLEEAYFYGYFPWPDNSIEYIPWAHPLQRGIIKMEEFHIPKTVRRLMKQNIFELRIDTAFEEVIRQCAMRPNGEETWITPEIIRFYNEFHKRSFVHSFEAWDRETNTLAGGLYGVSIGGLFAGESMFFRRSGASKFALACLGLTLQKCGVKVIDTQMVTPATELFGAKYVPRKDYLHLLHQYRSTPLTTRCLREAAKDCSLL